MLASVSPHRGLFRSLYRVTPDFPPDLFEEGLPAKFRDEHDMITEIPADVRQAACTHGYRRPPLLENGLANPFLSIAMEDF